MKIIFVRSAIVFVMMVVALSGVNHQLQGAGKADEKPQAENALSNPVLNNSANGGAIIDGLQLFAQTEKASISTGESVLVEVGLRNNSNEERVIYPSSLVEFPKWSVKNEKGEKVPLTAYGTSPSPGAIWFFGGGFSPGGAHLQSGDEFRFKLCISQIFDMSRPGIYTLSFQHKFSQRKAQRADPTKWATLVSNSLEIKVAKTEYYVSEGITSPRKAASAASSQGPSRFWKSPSATWQVGDAWPLSVELYTDAAPPPGTGPATETAEKKYVLVGQYPMQVRVAGNDMMEGQPCWMVDFIPASTAPSTMGRELYRVWVGKQDGLARRIVSLKNTFNPPLRKFKGIAFPDAQIVGFPLEFLPVNVLKAEESVPNGHLFTLTGEVNDTQTVVQARLRVQDRDRFLIKQTWPKGAKWWSEYEKQDYNQHLILKARLLQ